MSLKDRLRDDSIVHLKAGNELEKTTLRNILSAIGTKEKSGKNPTELNDQDVENLLRKEVSNREETAALAAKDGRAEHAERELAEAAFISTYLPKALGEAEAQEVVDRVMAELAADHELTMKDMGQAMKLVGAEIAGRSIEIAMRRIQDRTISADDSLRAQLVRETDARPASPVVGILVIATRPVVGPRLRARPQERALP